jgi:hypothetical protein
VPFLFPQIFALWDDRPGLTSILSNSLNCSFIVTC